MTRTKTTRIPAPLYAAAGVGDLAYRRLRQLPDVFSGLGGKAVATGAELRAKAESLRTARIDTHQLREQAAATTAGLCQKATATFRAANSAVMGLRDKAAELDLDRLRGLALRNAAAVVAGAQAAQQRAASVYDTLVSRGEQVIGSGVVQAADAVNEDMEATVRDETAAAPVEAAAPAAVVEAAAPEVEEPKPAGRATKRTAKATRPTAARVAKAAKATKAAKAMEGTARAAKATKIVKRTRPTTE